MRQDVHQYYFERYLRNEMSVNEKKAFESKLTTDNKVRSAFEHYKINRQEYLSDYVASIQKKSSNRKLNNWLYALVSTIGILISLNLYLANKQLRHLIYKPIHDSLPFYQRIPFEFGYSSPKANKSNAILFTSKDSAELGFDSITVDPSLISQDDTLNYDYDVKLSDTLVIVYEKSSFDQVYEKLKMSDSSLTDAELENLTLHQLTLPEFSDKHEQIEIEYWKSPAGFTGYVRVSAKKILFYGHEPNEKLVLLKTKEEIGIRQEEGNIFKLINDHNFHKF